MTVVEGNVSVYRVDPISRMTGDVRAEFSRMWGPGSDQKRAGLGGEVRGGLGGGEGWAGNSCVEAENPLRR